MTWIRLGRNKGNGFVHDARLCLHNLFQAEKWDKEYRLVRGGVIMSGQLKRACVSVIAESQI